MSGKVTWAEVERGDIVDLGGRPWTVLKIKKRGKRAEVRVEFDGRRAESTVALKDRVKIRTLAADADPVQDVRGAQRRWAKPAELEDVLGRGDPTRTKPPAKAEGPAWDERHAKGTAERTLEKVLGARLIAETPNEAAGYYVPPVDVTTVASHLALMHGGIPGSGEHTEGALLKVHDDQHAEAKTIGASLAVNHWHSDRRP